MSAVFENALYIAEIVIGIGLLIFVHELGHFVMAKRNGVRVHVFSLGFGPAIWKRQRGETEYRLSWIPLGGYVKMAGETALDERTGDKDELMSKSTWQKLQIFAAGATMNLLIAFPLCILVFLIGKYVPSSVVANPGHAEERAGMLPGDRIVAIDDAPVISLDQYLMEMVSRGYGESVKVTVVRDGERRDLTVVQGGSEEHRCFTLSNVVDEVMPDSVAAKAGIQRHDQVIAIDGRLVYDAQEIQDIVQESIGRPLNMSVVRKGEGWEKNLPLILTPEPKKIKRTPVDPAIVGIFVKALREESPARGILEPEDRLLSVNGRLLGDTSDLSKVVRESDGKPVEIEIVRKDRREKVSVRPARDHRGVWMIGVEMSVSNRLMDVDESGFYGKCGFKSGDRIVAINGKDALVSFQLFGYEKFTAVVEREGKEVRIEGKGADDEIGVVGIAFGMDMVYRTWGFGEAVSEGLEHPIYLGVLTFKMLYKLFAGQESTKALSGPIGIVQISFRSAELGIGNFIWILALITVSLGIFNLLPIPILDGGHILLLFFEKIKGKPLSMKFNIGFQYVGLFFILALLVFVCYNDIMRVF